MQPNFSCFTSVFYSWVWNRDPSKVFILYLIIMTPKSFSVCENIPSFLLVIPFISWRNQLICSMERPIVCIWLIASSWYFLTYSSTLHSSYEVVNLEVWWDSGSVLLARIFSRWHCVLSNTSRHKAHEVWLSFL